MTSNAIGIEARIMKSLHKPMLPKDMFAASRSRRRVLFIFPYDWLGSPRSVREVSLLENNKHETLIISTNMKYVIRSDIGILPRVARARSSERPTVYRLPFFVAPLVLPKQGLLFKLCSLSFFLLSTMAYSFWLFFLTLLICVTKRVDLIHAHNTPDLTGLISFIVSRIVGIPYIYEVHDLTPELYAETMNLQPGSFRFKFLKGIESIAIMNSAGNVFISEEMRRHFEATYKLDPARSVVLYSSWNENFLDSYQYKKTDLGQLLTMNSLDNKFKILYLGSMEDGFRRGVDIPVESLKYLVHTCRLDKAMLIYVGDGGGMIDKLSRLAQEYGISDHLSLRGMLPRYEAYKWLSLADVTVVPTRKAASTEIGVGNKTLEYMAAAKAIIASDLPGNREVIKDGYSGLLFRPNDHVDLATKIFLLTKTPNLIQRLGLNARKEFVERFCWEKQQTKILRLYNDILQNTQATACATEKKQ